ncbi:retrotransposon protein, putative, ty1-copia subclass, partial [Tanacetum coccineum]
RLSVVVVRPVNTRHRWDETCLLDVIVIKSNDVVGMALPVQNINHSAFRSMFEKEKLSGNNFNDWFARLKLILRVEKKMDVIEQSLPPAPPEPVAEPNIVAQWTALYDAHTEIACLMLGSMTPELHRQFELHYPYDMIQELRSMFEKQAGVEKFDLIQSFHACKQEEGKPVADYVLKMKGYVEKLERLGYVLPQDITVGLILNGLTKDFVGFVRNYNMHNMGKTIGEIHAMLIEYEKGLPKKAETPQVMMIKGGKIQKANKKSLNAKGQNKVKGKGKDKKVYIPKPKNPKPTAMERPAKDDACHHYNCHYAPTITRGVVSVSRLVDNGFVQCFTDYGISISKNNVLYFNAIARNGIYEIDMHDLVPNVNSIYNVSNKRVKRNLDSTYLWHCRLAHINKKRIKQLQQDGLLKSTDDESFDKCESCLSGKMTKKPFPHSNERAKDLLGIIHTDVCGAIRLGHVSRQKVFKNEVENQLGKTIKAIRSDRGGEYISQEFKDYLKANGIVQQLTPPYTPQHNGVSANAFSIGLTKNVDKTPYECWYEKFHTCPYLTDLEEIQEEEDTTPSEITSNIPQEVEGFEPPQPPQEEAIPIRRSERTRRTPNRLCLNVEVEEHSLRDLGETTNYKAAMLDPESKKCVDAMNADMQSMIDNMVWLLVDLPPNCKTVRSKWILKKKIDMDGNVHIYKARLVVKGYTQTYMVDYEETFSPVANIRAIRILISIAAFYDYEIWQMDVKTAFLNGYLDEDIYMVQPEGFVNPNHPRKVCKLQRFIYGLKQASRSWNKRFDEEIKKFGFDQNLDETCVYQKASGSNVTFLILYVDDIIIMGNHIPSLQSVKNYLGKCFSMKDLGEAAFILGIKIYRDRSKRLIGLSQNAYMDKILKRYKMDNSKRGTIPMQERLDLNKSQGAQTPKEVNRMKNVPYASAVGSIMYAVRCTRPDVAFAQNLTSRFQQNPGELHWTAVKNILKYLRNTKDMFLVYGGNPSTELRVECYCDAGFETDRDDTKSQTGYVFVLNGGAVDWKSSKQSTIAMSATESEYIAASEAAMEAVWIRKFISGLGIVPTINEPLNMYCDNSAAIHYANEPGVQRGARHYHRRYHYVRECVELGEIRILKVHTDNNLADHFTKALSNRKLTQHARSIGLRPAISFM